MTKTNPFKKGPPNYGFLCSHAGYVENVAMRIGQRIARCIEHKVPLTYRVTCGDNDCGNYLRMLLKGRGLDPKAVSRKDFRQAGGKHRVCGGDGPVVYGVIPVDFLPIALTTLGPKAKPGVIVVQAQVAEAPAKANVIDPAGELNPK